MIIASDFDGTLCKWRPGGNSGVSAEDREAIRIWQERGHKFGLVTGRGADIRHTAADCGVNLDYSIVYNGALIMDAAGDVLYEAYADAFYIAPILKYAEENASLCQKGSVLYALHDTKKPADAGNIKGFYQISFLLENDADANALTAKLNMTFGDVVIAYANGRCIDTVKKGISKATGIAEYARLTCVADWDIYVIGDNYNDLPMLSAYNGYVVNSASDDMKTRVNHTCEDMSELMAIAYGNCAG